MIFTGIAFLLSVSIYHTSPRFLYDNSHQAVQRVRADKGALFDLFDRIENFFRRLEVYVNLPLMEGMTTVIVNVMVEVLLIIALATREIQQGKLSELISDDRKSVLIYFPSEGFFKKLRGRSDIEDALQRLDKLTREEHRMAAAQDLFATQRISERVTSMENDLQRVDEGVKGLDMRVQGVGDGVKGAYDRINVVIDGEYLLSGIWLVVSISH